MASEEENSSESMETTFTFDQTAGGTFMSLDDLGNLLLHLTSQGYYHLYLLLHIFFLLWSFLKQNGVSLRCFSYQ